jgi:glutaminyl-peptide cyclotransferase
MVKSFQKLIESFTGLQSFRHLELMESLGPRIPDSLSHKKLQDYIHQTGNSTRAKFYKQEYSFDFLGKKTCFSNLIYIFEGIGTKKKKLLLGTHYDSRVIADNEKDIHMRNKPIMGINDGGSGTAVFIELLSILNDNPCNDDIALVFFDAEDVGNIDGYNFSEGAEYFAENFKEFIPDEVIVIDMIGGINASYQIDLEAFYSSNSNNLLTRIWQIGYMFEFKPFTSNTDFNGSYFICDHTPFVKRKIPSMLLIDINYKWWHTQDDRIIHCSPESLEAAGRTLLYYIYLQDFDLSKT